MNTDFHTGKFHACNKKILLFLMVCLTTLALVTAACSKGSNSTENDPPSSGNNVPDDSGSPVITGTTYYVSNNGNDDNDGLSEETPWKTIVQVNSHVFQPGDGILFRRGDTWRTPEDARLTVSSAGSTTDWLVYGAYGPATDSKPRIIGSRRASAWSNYSGHIWQTTSISSIPYSSFGGTYWAEIAIEKIDGTSAWGNHQDSIAALATEYDWTWQNGTIYLYAPSDPDTLYSSVEVPQVDNVVGFSYSGYNDYPQYVHFDNLELLYTARQGIFTGYPVVHDPTGVSVRGLKLTNSLIAYVGHRGSGSAYCLAAWQSDSAVLNNVMHDCGRRAVSFNTYNDADDYVTIQNVVIDHNYFYNGWHTTGVDISTDNTIGHHFDNFTISNNIFDDSQRMSGSAAISSNSVYVEAHIEYADTTYWTNFFIYNNVVINPVSRAFLLNGIDGLYFYHNTVYGIHPEAHPWAVVDFSQTKNVDMRNNIFYGTPSASIEDALIQNEHGYYYTERNYNLYYQQAANQPLLRIRADPDGNAEWAVMPNEWSDFVQTFGHETDSPVPQDPLFVDPAQGDLRLQPSSPARNSGTPIPIVTTDILGNPRSATHPSIGAYEGD